MAGAARHQAGGHGEALGLAGTTRLRVWRVPRGPRHGGRHEAPVVARAVKLRAWSGSGGGVVRLRASQAVQGSWRGGCHEAQGVVRLRVVLRGSRSRRRREALDVAGIARLRAGDTRHWVWQREALGMGARGIGRGSERDEVWRCKARGVPVQGSRLSQCGSARPKPCDPQHPQELVTWIKALSPRPVPTPIPAHTQMMQTQGAYGEGLYAAPPLLCRTTEQKPNPLANTKLRAAQVQSVMQPRPEVSPSPQDRQAAGFRERLRPKARMVSVLRRTGGRF